DRILPAASSTGQPLPAAGRCPRCLARRWSTGESLVENQSSRTFATYRRRASPLRSAAFDRSADPLGQRHDYPLRAAHVGHAPGVLVLADVADQPVAVRG